jgi:octaprenyl-diphosphate synthase
LFDIHMGLNYISDHMDDGGKIGMKMQIAEVFQYYANDLKRVDAYMDSQMQSEVKIIPEIIRHLIGSGGKRLRPLLLLASSSLCGYNGDRRYYMAAVIEFIHTATLLHDDVIDHAQIRRGKVSANNIWGNAASVLVGDFLYSKSFSLMAEQGNLDIITLLSSATSAMSEGEVFQLVKCGDSRITEEEYLTIIEKKTAVLIAAACAVGGMLSNVQREQIQSLIRFGTMLGSAFQITDDTLDYMAEEEQFGKAIGKDLQEGKVTLPLIRTLKVCTPEESKAVKTFVEQANEGNKAVKDVVAVIRKYDGIEYALNKAKAYIEEGKACLDSFAASDAKRTLITIADYVAERRL